MRQVAFPLRKEFTDFGLFCGIGGIALGLSRSAVQLGGFRGSFRSLGGVDVDPVACRDFFRIVGVPATCLDLATREQYEDINGRPPPGDWREATPEDIRRAAQDQFPNLVTLSSPCKGLSGLLGQKKAATRKYQALNELTVRGVFLTLEAFAECPPDVIFFENVPRIQTRGVHLLEQMRTMLESYGYAVHCGTHNAGEVGGLGQNRVRFFMVARHVEKVPRFVYQPVKRPMRSIGSVLAELPWPGDVEAGGIMHRLPQIHLKTALRLACVRPGHDWRDLNDDRLGRLRIGHSARDGAWRVSEWDRACGSVTGASGVGRSNSTLAVEDLRVQHRTDRHSSKLKVQVDNLPSNTVTGSDGVSGGALSVGDLRVGSDGYPGLHGVCVWHSPGPTVTSSASVSSSNMAAAIGDLRLNCSPRPGAALCVQAADRPSGTVAASADIWATASAVQDQRFHVPIVQDGYHYVFTEDEPGKWSWHRPLTDRDLAALQDLHLDYQGRRVDLEGSSRLRRQHIGNAVPPAAMAAVGNVILHALCKAARRDENVQSVEVWVRPGQDINIYEEVIDGS